MKRVALVCLFVALLVGCQNKDNLPVTETIFEAPTVSAVVDTKVIEEVSGLATCSSNPGLFWALNDGHNEAKIFLIDSLTRMRAIILLDSIQNRDWEDIAAGPGPEEGKNYVYVGDIGDNDSKHKFKFIYRFEEPQVKTNGSIDTTISKVDCIKFQLPDGSRDSESLMLDPLTRDIYILSKREQKVNLYRLPYPQSTSEVIMAELAASELEFNQLEEKIVSKKDDQALINGYHASFYNQIVSSDISNDGQEILIKSYSSVYYWKRLENESITTTIQRMPIRLPYVPEPQGEAITFDYFGKGYYTLSEKRGEDPQRLFFYKRK